MGPDWANNHFPLDPDGNVYRAAQGWGALLNYRDQNPNSYSGDYAKASNQSENDYTDLINLCYALSPNVSNADYTQAVSTNTCSNASASNTLDSIVRIVFRHGILWCGQSNNPHSCSWRSRSHLLMPVGRSSPASFASTTSATSIDKG